MNEQPPTDRFWGKVSKGGDDDCWLWTDAPNSKGYGRIHVGGRRGRREYAHRFAYEMLRGPIPEGMQLDHTCRNRLCVNPAHLEPVSGRENVRRGIKGELTTHCPKGHPYDAENTYISRRGHRSCRACKRDRERMSR